MADKLDFMTELAKDVDARKHGQTSSFGTINDFVPKNRVVRETDYDREQDYENTRPVSTRPANHRPQPQAYEQPRQEYTQPQQVYEPQQEYTQPQQVYESQQGYDTPEYEEEYQETPVFTEPVSNNDNEETRPASFHEEERVKIEKPKFNLSPIMIGGAIFAILLIGFLAQYLPWALVPRGTYIYHYFASVPFLIICITLLMEQIQLRRRKAASFCMLGFILAAAGFFGLLFPYASGIFAPTGWLEAGRKILNIWY